MTTEQLPKKPDDFLLLKALMRVFVRKPAVRLSDQEMQEIKDNGHFLLGINRIGLPRQLHENTDYQKDLPLAE